MLGSQTLTLIRQAAGSFTNGVWTPGAETQSTFSGSIQPLNSREIQLLPEGARAEGRRKLYTNTQLRTTEADQAFPADQVFHLSERWEVQANANYDSGIGMSLYHYKYELRLLANDEES